MARQQVGEIKISLSRKKSCYENMLVDRLWRTVKYEKVYLHAYVVGWEAEISLPRFLRRHWHVKLHRALRVRTLHEVYTRSRLYPFRPELMMSRIRPDQQKAITSFRKNNHNA